MEAGSSHPSCWVPGSCQPCLILSSWKPCSIRLVSQWPATYLLDSWRPCSLSLFHFTAPSQESRWRRSWARCPSQTRH
uniref:Ubiquitin associated domain containing 2 n=1 Tax=Mus musculus TaxID=10090 RepID=A0A2I3BQW8_MOUSE